jgi:hypothetical protein
MERNSAPARKKVAPMRTPAQQVEGLCVVWDLMPSNVRAELRVSKDPESDTPALRVGGYEAVYATDGFDIWETDGDLVAIDLDAKAAVDRLLEGAK